MRAKYVNLFTDFGFKKIFGEESNKAILIDFLNALIAPPSPIADISFKPSERLGENVEKRKAVFDLYCESDNGDKFIVGLQKARQDYFIERSVYYATFPIKEQAEKGEWDFNLRAVYCIGILGFVFKKDIPEDEQKKVVQTLRLSTEKGTVFYDKLTIYYLQMPNFNKTIDELETRLDKWLYFIKNLEDISDIPTIFQESVFVQAFSSAEIARFDHEEMDSYEASLKVFRDNLNTERYALKTARIEGFEDGLEEGFQDGLEEGIKKTAKALKDQGFDKQFIKNITGLTDDEIDNLLYLVVYVNIKSFFSSPFAFISYK